MLVSKAVVPGNHRNRLINTGQENTPIEIALGGVVIFNVPSGEELYH